MPDVQLGIRHRLRLELKAALLLLLLHLLFSPSSPLVVAAGPGALELTVASVFAIYTNAIRCHVPIFILR